MSKNLPPLEEVALVCDVDSTAVNHETLSGFVHYLGDNAVAEVEGITRQGMNGQMGFAESLRLRGQILHDIGATRRDVLNYKEKMRAEAPAHITPSFAQHAEWIQEQVRNGKFFFVSGGEVDMVVPLLGQGLGVESDNNAIWTNSFTYEDTSLSARITGFDPASPLYHDRGKLRQIHALRASGAIGNEVVFIMGDGDNDRKGKGPNGADYFIALKEIEDRGLGGPDNGVDFTAQNLPEAVGFITHTVRGLGAAVLASESEFNPTREAV